MSSLPPVILFPVEVTLPAEGDDPPTVYKPAKVYAHEGVTDVYVWQAGEAALVATLEGTPVEAGFRQHEVAGAHIGATGGCGCGHPLKRWSPPRPVVG